MVQFRRQRMGDQLRVELAELIQREVRDPRVGFVTVTEVRMSGDLKYARVYVSILGNAEQKEESLAALARASGFLKAQIGKRMKFRQMPELRFVVDDTLDHAEHIDALLASAPPPSAESAEEETSDPGVEDETADG